MDFITDGTFKPHRGLSQETLQHWNYRRSEFKGQPCYVFEYRSHSGELLAQKVRLPGKDFLVIGSLKSSPLGGMHLWRDTGKQVVIVEGEVDAMSMSQAFGNRWPVVTLPSGASSAAKTLRANIEWLRGFERVILMFDMDDPGREAARAAAEVLPPGRAFIAQLPLKDPNEMLQAGRVKELVDAVWGAKKHSPAGIIEGSDITPEALQVSCKRGLPLPYPKLDEALHGLRRREITLLTAGSGIGKSTLARELAFHLVRNHGQRIANVFLEESYQKTAQGYVALYHSVPLGSLREDPAVLSKEQWAEATQAVVRPQYFFDHFGSLESDALIGKLEYFAVGLEVDFIVLDHISIVVSGQEGSGEGERKDIDKLMTELRALVERTGVGVIVISHLKRPGGQRRSYNEGGRVTLQDLRGSAALEQLSDNIIALERNQQDADASNLSQIRLLKNREWGNLGEADVLEYDTRTGRYVVSDGSAFDPVEDGGAAGEEDF